MCLYFYKHVWIKMYDQCVKKDLTVLSIICVICWLASHHHPPPTIIILSIIYTYWIKEQLKAITYSVMMIACYARSNFWIVSGWLASLSIVDKYGKSEHIIITVHRDYMPMFIIIHLGARTDHKTSSRALNIISWMHKRKQNIIFRQSNQ